MNVSLGLITYRATDEILGRNMITRTKIGENGGWEPFYGPDKTKAPPTMKLTADVFYPLGSGVRNLPIRPAAEKIEKTVARAAFSV